MCKHEEKHCPRCNSIFECKPGNIMQCQCSTIKLTEAVKLFIQKEYNDCLCLNCLEQLSKNRDIARH